jgi:hypothetical protein
MRNLKRARELQSILAGGNVPKRPWTARERPKRMTKLIRERLGEIAEIAEIASYLNRAIPLCDARNQLAHGIWWRFVAETGAVTVSTDREADPHLDFAPADIDRNRRTIQRPRSRTLETPDNDRGARRHVHP